MIEKKDQDQKRLVLIGVHRKGEKGFKKRIDKEIQSKDFELKPESLTMNPEQIYTVPQTSNISPE